MRTIKNIFIKFSVFLLPCMQSANAQNPTPEFEKLKLNSSPAFVILGVSPENLQRPTTPTQFLGGVQNAIVNDRLKPNFAFELTPYFWINPVKDSFRFKPEKYLVPEKNPFKTITQSFSISLGSSESDTVVFENLEPGTGLGLGLRFTIIDGKPKGKSVERLKLWNRLFHQHAIISSISGRIQSRDDDVTIESIVENEINNFRQRVGDTQTLYHLATLYDVEDFIKNIRVDVGNFLHLKDADLLTGLNMLADSLNKRESRLLAEINKEKIPFAKTGFILEFAYGSAIIFQNNKWNNAQQAKSAIWLTPSYRWQVNTDPKNISLLDLVGVVRFTFNNTRDGVDIANYFDLGLKTDYTHNKWSFSMEGVYRKASEKPINARKDHTYRLVSSLDYKLNDTITFKFAFGTNFDGNTATYNDPKEMFAVGGLNLGIFNPKNSK